MSTPKPTTAKAFAQQILNRAKAGSQDYGEAAITRALRVTGDIPELDHKRPVNRPDFSERLKS
jgi:hypothetical protein